MCRYSSMCFTYTSALNEVDIIITSIVQNEKSGLSGMNGLLAVTLVKFVLV